MIAFRFEMWVVQDAEGWGRTGVGKARGKRLGWVRIVN